MTTPITIVGNLTGDPELRVTQSGHAVTSFTVAVNERRKTDNGYEDDGATFYRVSVWRDQAEHVADQLRKGQRVIVQGGFRARTFEGRDGGERLSLDITADEVGPSLRFASGKPSQTARTATAAQVRGGNDPWNTGADQAPF